MTSTTLQGAPFRADDPILVECEGVWREGTVTQVVLMPGARFGLRWMLHVRLGEHEQVLARCDDDGRNHTYREQVMGSQRVVA